MFTQRPANLRFKIIFLCKALLGRVTNGKALCYCMWQLGCYVYVPFNIILQIFFSIFWKIKMAHLIHSLIFCLNYNSISIISLVKTTLKMSNHSPVSSISCFLTAYFPCFPSLFQHTVWRNALHHLLWTTLKLSLKMKTSTLVIFLDKYYF